MTAYDVDVLAIGAGPANLALAVALEESGDVALAQSTLVLEQHPDVKWQRNLLLPWARSQVSFLKDLVTLRNPRSRFTFLNFLHERRRLDEFVNLATFNPYRQELSDYQQWVAHSLEHVKVRYNARVERVEPRRGADHRIVGWTVYLAGGDRIACRDLVFGTGRDARIPAEFAGLPTDKVIHSTQYTSRITEILAEGRTVERPVVVGGAQSAAEMFMAVHTDLPGSMPTMVMRSIGLQNYQTSKFVNELFYPSFVDEFYYCDAESRRRILDQVHLTNYAGLAPPFLDELYSMLYSQKLFGQQRSRIVPMVDVVGAQLDGEDIVLSLRDIRSGRIEELRSDLVLLGTGYSPEMPAMVRALADLIGVSSIEVSRRYRWDIGEHAWGAVYLQGMNEATHGISDTLISVLAHRSQDIVDDLLDRRAELGERAVVEVRSA
ncbi:lysine N(6)-hydroxylase/L-ornithine N(5)-oxygenase family protein [Nocardia sp. CDC159]|uniref:L-lysine N6-monooxygenase MbtG n=1 Tax=Nocardia pulmonis TaxID=2951408 RepID=A0A9X2E6G5_9NOCA|nr:MULTISPECIES: SidA/IucD/PvdA family monooxygenase [Nocardia]MCM6774679.1 lysine N(6)-hydroxylase/L-ornithine N(5)-oxygenase family protein [Nocardia pulmonis]MCM6787256.1 lysine N(6)-hydroxylase/L-ornithine N(5)-oxygenase family protein [Nocardia sp. CDC159]